MKELEETQNICDHEIDIKALKRNENTGSVEPKNFYEEYLDDVHKNDRPPQCWRSDERLSGQILKKGKINQ